MLVLILGNTGCEKDLFKLDRLVDNQWDPEFAVAMVNGSVGINDIDLTNNSFLQVNADKSVSVVYTGTISNYNAADFIPRMVSTPLQQTIALSPQETAGFALIPVGTAFSINSNQAFDLSTQTNIKMDIDSIILKTGIANIDIDNKFSHNVSLQITIPAIIKNGAPLTTTVNVGPNAKGNATIDVSDVVCNLTKNGTTSNFFEATYRITFTKTASPILSGSLTITGNILNPTLRLVYGEAKQQNFLNKPNDSIPINIFETPVSGSFLLNDATLKLSFANSFGIPIQIAIPQVRGYSPTNGTFFLNTGAINPQNFLIAAPANIRQTANSVLTLTKNNPPSNGNLLNLPEFLSKLPRSFAPQFSAQTNPSTVTRPAYRNFVCDTSKMKIVGEINIPLEGKASNFLVRDTFDYDFGKVDKVQSIVLRAWFNNGFPITLSPRFTFTDNNYNVIHVIDGQTNALVNAAPVDANGKVTSKQVTQSEFTIPNSVVQNLTKVKKVIMTAGIATISNGTQNVKIYSDYLIDVKIGARAILKP
ncbi:MAG: hypothetical protein ACOVNY_06835 [Chitinophagaceae bacterium]